MRLDLLHAGRENKDVETDLPIFAAGGDHKIIILSEAREFKAYFTTALNSPGHFFAASYFAIFFAIQKICQNFDDGCPIRLVLAPPRTYTDISTRFLRRYIALQ